MTDAKRLPVIWVHAYDIEHGFMQYRATYPSPTLGPTEDAVKLRGYVAFEPAVGGCATCIWWFESPELACQLPGGLRRCPRDGSGHCHHHNTKEPGHEG
jgi:hypothetical protein